MNFAILNLQNRAGIGSIVLRWNEAGRVDRIEWPTLASDRAGSHPALKRSVDAVVCGEPPPQVRRLSQKLKEYFILGEPIGELPWDAIEQSTWTPFQAQVYRALEQVPHGETRTYAWLARKIGRFGASRAVGQALRRNSVPLLIPCHRIISSAFAGGGALGGFMGASDPGDPEIQLKRALLAHEQSYRNPMFDFLFSSMPVGAAG